MHADGDLPLQGRPAERWPDDGPDPDPDPDPDWPDDWPAPTGPESRTRRRGSGIAALAVVALVALGAGAGAVYIYQQGLAGSTPASHGNAAAPGAGRTASPVPGGNPVHGMMLLGPVRAVGRDSVTVGGGPEPEISAVVTSATQFTGSARSLAQVRVGDTVAIQISESDGVARVVTLQDPGTAT